ncbi:lipoprotein [Actinoplanes sp. NBRC 14428]|uniref:Lysophospholipase L1-like esterase n=1 Tax=Pseudosporangium ferrugineum TaxID=439699 RepID=A0A2T0SIZ8_9ACTN|nr:GDSL-type esterase/lipase family protein [Pseudosporangium ferrugineum]PRY33375.1 lysophospholipase L1-like esterase [Pseudosporangium ferrugineum]BCJ48625.1 lipoprotein [Actinoplanes sp. NBRC 14428]
MPHRWQVVVLAVLSAVALACEGAGNAGPAPTGKPKPKPGRPSSMVALGDSITAGFGSCTIFVACSRNSWATGSADAVDSHYRRIREANPAIKGHARNLAVPGAQAADLPGQAASAVDSGAEYVTVLIGANDACSGGVDEMTPVRTFRGHLDKAFGRLRKGLPRSRVLVVSIPDVHRLWQLGHDDPGAVRAWRRGICPAMLANPTSTAAADQDRRRRVADRIDAYNDQLARACDAYGDRCRWDGGAAHGIRFSLDLVNRTDYFHPNVAGQNRLADATYPVRFTW